MSIILTNEFKNIIFELNSKKMQKISLIDQLNQLEQEHRDLDEVLIQLQEKQTVDFLQIQRLKKRKLILKDKINFLKNKIEPDIIA